MISQYNSPQQPWKCLCGNENIAKKVRCSKCQKWRNGKRAPRGANASKWHATQQLTAAASSSEAPQAPWTCDKCGNANEASKVRCAACPRWKDGKRRKYGKMAKEKALACGSGSGQPSWAQLQKYKVTMAMHQAQWVCPGCNHLNAGEKARCGSCQVRDNRFGCSACRWGGWGRLD